MTVWTRARYPAPPLQSILSSWLLGTIGGCFYSLPDKPKHRLLIEPIAKGVKVLTAEYSMSGELFVLKDNTVQFDRAPAKLAA